MTTTKRINKNTLRSTLRRWEKGEVSKEAVERRFGVTNAHGKWITRQWFTRLGVDTRYGKAVTPRTKKATNAARTAIVGS